MTYLNFKVSNPCGLLQGTRFRSFFWGLQFKSFIVVLGASQHTHHPGVTLASGWRSTLVTESCYVKCHRLGIANNNVSQCFGDYEVQVQGGSKIPHLLKGPFMVCRWPPSSRILTRLEEIICLVPPLIRTLIPFMRSPPSQPNYLPKAQSLDIIPLGFRG